MTPARTKRTCPVCREPVGPRQTFCGDTCRKRFSRRASSGLVRLSVRQRLKLAAHVRRFPGQMHSRPEGWTNADYDLVRSGKASHLTTSQVGSLIEAYPGSAALLFAIDESDEGTLLVGNPVRGY